MSRYTVEVKDRDGFVLETRGFSQRPAAEDFMSMQEHPAKLIDHEEETRAVSRRHLESAGEALFGDRWQRSMAAALDVNERRVRGWVAGERPIPPTIWSELAKLLKQRAKLCEDLAKRSAELHKRGA